MMIRQESLLVDIYASRIQDDCPLAKYRKQPARLSCINLPRPLCKEEYCASKDIFCLPLLPFTIFSADTVLKFTSVERLGSVEGGGEDSLDQYGFPFIFEFKKKFLGKNLGLLL